MQLREKIKELPLSTLAQKDEMEALRQHNAELAARLTRLDGE
ncbi:MAG: hypothetical protein R2911_38080 [Caldilineaceae bacterium]